MKEFLIVLKDLLTPNYKEACRIAAISKESLIEQFKLVRCKNQKEECYWNGEQSEVLIFLYEINDKEISSAKDFRDLINYWACAWY